MLLVVISLFSFLPVIFIFVFADTASAMQSLIGAIVLTFSFTGLFASQSVYFNKQWFRFQDMLVASKVSPASYAVGLSVSGLVVALPGVLVALALLLLSGPSTALGIVLLLATSLLLWIGLVFVGFAIGATTKNARRANSIPQVLSIALGFLPPVYYPLDRLPAIVQPIAMLIPTTHAAQLAKYYFHLIDIPPSQVAIGWAYLIGFAPLMAFNPSRRAPWIDPKQRTSFALARRESPRKARPRQVRRPGPRSRDYPNYRLRQPPAPNISLARRVADGRPPRRGLSR